MRPAIRCSAFSKQTLQRTQRRYASAPPQPRPYRPATTEEREARRRAPDEDFETKPPKKRGRLAWLNPFADPAPSKPTEAPEPVSQEPRDPQRGIEAARRYLQDGVVDPKYKSAATKVIFGLAAMVVAIGLTPEVYKRTFKGKKRKEVPPAKSETEGASEQDGARTEP